MWHVYCCFVFGGTRAHNSLSKYVSVPCRSTLNVDFALALVQRDLNEWLEAPSDRHHGCTARSCIDANILLPVNTPSTISLPAASRRKKMQKKWENQRWTPLLSVKNPHITIPDWSHFLPYLPLSLLRRPLPSPSPSIFLALPPQLSLIACEVINGFHLTSSPTLRRAPTNKTRAQNTNCPPEEP